MRTPEEVDPAKIMMAGDWHGNGAWAQKCIHHARKQHCDVIVHAGDFGWWRDDILDTHNYLRHVQRQLVACGITLYWVDGNHEDHDKIQEWLDATDGQPWSDKRYPNIVHLPRGFRWQWWGQTWLAMGGAHSVDRLQRTPGKSWWDGEHITEAQIDRAIMGGPADVMVCHDCPDGVQIPGIHADEKLNAEQSFWPLSEIIASNVNRMKLRRVCDIARPKVLWHGHYHVRYDNLLRYGDGEATLILGLADDGSYDLERNTLLLHKRDEQ